VDVNLDPDANPNNGTGVIYVANNGNNSVLAFNNASNINGETIPDRTIFGGQTGISDPVGIFVDNYVRASGTSTGGNGITTLRDTTQSFTVNLFANFLVVITGGTGQGQVRTIASNTATQLTVSPTWNTTPNNTSTYQIRPDFLYVANNSTNSILGFNSASTLSGNTAPDRTITGASTLLSSPTGIFIANVDLNPLSGFGVLYAANFSNSSVTVFNNASIATGNIVPDRTILDAIAALPSPAGLSVDIENDRLYMATPLANSIQVIDHASQLQSASPPVVRSLSGASSTLSSPGGVTVDVTADPDGDASNGTGVLYVANTGASSILVFNNASLTNGNTAPDRTIFPASGTACGDSATTQRDLCSPGSVFIDTINDRLYVANTGANSILVFNNASSITASAAPDRIISGLNSPSGVFVDVTNDLLYVVNTGTNSILVFNASTANGDIVPSRTIAQGTDLIDNTTLNTPSGIFVDVSNNLLYVSNSGTTGTGANSILVFDDAGIINGNVAPTQTISGTATTLNTPLGIFVDTTR
jgi:DNA-binding beta-propeller fold protein YncE